MRVMRLSLLMVAVALLLGATGILSCGSKGMSERGASAQDGFVLTPITGGVSMLVGPGGGNIGVLAGADGILLVDTQFPHTVAPIRKVLEGAGGEIRWIVNTHFHQDHSGGNAGLGGAATRMAHARVRDRLQHPDPNQPAADPAALPQVVWEDGVALFVNGQRVEIRHAGPAHTDGDSIVRFQEAKVLHLGDLFFNGWFPFVDLDHGGTVRGLLAALEEIHAGLDDSWKIIPGHGPLADRAALGRSIAMIRMTLGIVEQRVKSGMTLAQVLGAGLPAEYESWSWKFIPTHRWLETLARECGAE
jgi:glyoxylase-like metal-dependent hydrolase (beta-lactamase superfamily II)